MQCQECGKESVLSSALPFCPQCLRQEFHKLEKHIKRIHENARKPFRLPVKASDGRKGKRCSLCVNQCVIPLDEFGFCGARKNISGQIKGPDKTWSFVDWYHDPLPTNCVADWVCDGNHDHGYKNLAVFYETCSFDCLFCQNWHYRERARKAPTDDLEHAVDTLTACVCFFGGDPTPSAFQTIEIAERLAEKKRKIHICWETNGSLSPAIMEKWAEHALRTNGCIKIDFKTCSDSLNHALCGASNKNTLENIRRLAEFMRKRPKPPLLIASTLLIPGYIDEYELNAMAEFLSGIDTNIPWSFLGFSPQFLFSDMPRTSRRHAEMALKIAQQHGLTRTRIGNIHLLI